MINSVVEAILEHGIVSPHKYAIADNKISLTYEELSDCIRGTAKLLVQSGMQPNAKIIIEADASVEFVIAYFGVHLANGIAIPIDKSSSTISIQKVLDDVQVFAVFVWETKNIPTKNIYLTNLCMNRTKDWFNPMPYCNQISDIFFTSGTTGKGKGVVLTHKNIISGAQNIISGSNKNVNDIQLVTSPLNHAYGFGTVRAMLLAGGMSVLQNGCASLKSLHNNLTKYNCTSLILVPAALKLLYKQLGSSISSLFANIKYIELGSSVLELEYKKLFLDLLPNTKLLINYGSTESSRTVYNDIRLHPDKILSIGKAVNNVNVKIVDEKGNPIISSKEHSGKLAFQGDMNMKEYYNAPELTSSVLKDGWFYTNDIAYIDDDEYIFLLGRDNDVINIGGEKVSAYEIENVFNKIDCISSCACIMIPDTENILGEIPTLFYTGTELDPISISQHMEKELERIKHPKFYKYIDEMPLNAMGKIDKRSLQRMWKHTN